MSNELEFYINLTEQTDPEGESFYSSKIDTLRKVFNLSDDDTYKAAAFEYGARSAIYDSQDQDTLSRAESVMSLYYELLKTENLAKTHVELIVCQTQGNTEEAANLGIDILLRIFPNLSLQEINQIVSRQPSKPSHDTQIPLNLF